MLVYLNGKLINQANALIRADNRSFRYGDGYFETIKCIDHKLPLWDYHEQRIFASLDTLQFQKPGFFTAAFVKDAIHQLVKKNQVGKLARVRLTIFRGEGGIYDAINHRPNLLIQTWPLNPENNKLNENGLVTGDFTEGFKAADGFANLKSNNYLLYAMAALHAKKMRWNDALLFNHKGTYCDATIANVWAVVNGLIITPPLTDGPVAGTMRRYLIDHLPQMGWPVMERAITPADIEIADELFLSNAIYGMKWVGQHAGRKFSGNLVKTIHQKLVAPLWSATK